MLTGPMRVFRVLGLKPPACRRTGWHILFDLHIARRDPPEETGSSRSSWLRSVKSGKFPEIVPVRSQLMFQVF